MSTLKSTFYGLLVVKMAEALRRFGKTKTATVVVTLVVAAGVWHALRIGAKPLWVDEAEAWRQAKDNVNPDTHPPLYFRLLNVVISRGDEREAVLRAPSAVAAALAVIFVWWGLGAVGVNDYYRWGGAAAAAFSPYLLLVGQQARMYGLAALVGAAFTAATLAWRRRRNWGAAAVMAGAGALGVYCVYSFWFTILASLWLWPWRDRRGRIQGLAAVGFIAAVFAPHFLLAASAAKDTGLSSSWGVGTALAGLKATVGAVFYFGAGFAYHPLGVGIRGGEIKKAVGASLAAAATAAPLLTALAARRTRPQAWRLALFVATSLGVNFVAPSGAEQLAAAFGAFIILWIEGLSVLPPAIRVLVVATWAVNAGYASAVYFRFPLYPLHAEDWRSAGRYAAAAYREGAVVVTKAGPGGPAALAYYGGARGVDLGRGGLGLSSEQIPDWVERQTRSAGRVILVYGDWGEEGLKRRLRGLAAADLGVTFAPCGEGLVVMEFRDWRR